jgi:DnaJ-domain-containing protein 1
MMRDWLSDRFRVSEQGSFGLSRVVDEAYRLRENIDVARACDTLREVFEEDETAALIVFLTDLADSDAHGLTRAARARIRDIGVRLGVNAAAIDLVLTRNPKLDEDACAILGLPTDATAEEVRRVYRLLASQFHPDSAAGLTAEQVRQSQEAFVRIKAAYDRLIAQLGAD